VPSVCHRHASRCALHHHRTGRVASTATARGSLWSSTPRPASSGTVACLSPSPPQGESCRASSRTSPPPAKRALSRLRVAVRGLRLARSSRNAAHPEPGRRSVLTAALVRTDTLTGPCLLGAAFARIKSCLRRALACCRIGACAYSSLTSHDTQLDSVPSQVTATREHSRTVASRGLRSNVADTRSPDGAPRPTAVLGGWFSEEPVGDGTEDCSRARTQPARCFSTNTRLARQYSPETAIGTAVNDAETEATCREHGTCLHAA